MVQSYIELSNKDYPILVVGDIHGDLTSLEKILLKWHEYKQPKIVFLGDYADRGPNGIEVIEKISKLQKESPNVICLKGNHEDYTDGYPNFYPCDLCEEIRNKHLLVENYFDINISPFFDRLYIACIVGNNYLLVHGGISSKILCRESLINPSKQIENDILWSDPDQFIGRECPSSRGVGVLFGNKILASVLSQLNIKKIIRSHQPRLASKEPLSMFNDQIITISSTNVYGGIPHILILESENTSRTEFLS